MKTLLVLNTPPSLEEDMVDYLLNLPYVEGFTSFEARGHGENTQMNITEQVTGRRRRIQFEMILNEELAQSVISGLAAQVGRDITYWQLPASPIGRT